MAKSPVEIFGDGSSASPTQPNKRDIRDYLLWLQGQVDPSGSGTGVDFAADLTAHIDDESNPHHVTADQIGLGDINERIGVNVPLYGDRPGDSPHNFVDTLTDGDPVALPEITIGIQATDENGRVRRLTGAGIVATRVLYPLEPNKVYLTEFVVQRRVNTPDPSNDAVRCALAWYDQGKSTLAPSFTVVRDITTLTVGSGRVLVTALVSRAAGEDIIAAPANSRYCRPYVQTYGTLAQSDIEVIRWVDVTNATEYSPDLTALEGRVSSLESLDLSDRLSVLEEQVTAPNVVRLPTNADISTANIPVSTDIIETLGYASPGDGKAGRYIRSDSNNFTVRSADGAYWLLSEIIMSMPAAADTNTVARATGNGTYDWVSVLYKRMQGGKLKTGTTFSIMAHTGPYNVMASGAWPQRNLDPPEPGVMGITSDSDIANRRVASVSLYNDTFLPPPLATVSGTFTETMASLTAPLSDAILAELGDGEFYVRTVTSGHTGKITAVSTDSITVSGWYALGNTSPGQVPSGTQDILVGVVDKAWVRNTVALVDSNSYGLTAIADEVDCGNYGIDYDLFAGTGTQSNGINIASVGPKKTHWALLVSRQSGDGAFARGVYVSGVWYAAYTAGSWDGDTQTPIYGFLYNYAGGKAFAVGGTPAGGGERMYVDGSGNISTQAQVGLGATPTANNRLISQGYGTAGLTNALSVKDSAGATRMTIRDNGLIYAGAFTVANLLALTGVTAGANAYATNGRRSTQGAGAGTGVMCFYDSTGNWIAYDSGVPVTA